MANTFNMMEDCDSFLASLSTADFSANHTMSNNNFLLDNIDFDFEFDNISQPPPQASIQKHVTSIGTVSGSSISPNSSSSNYSPEETIRDQKSIGHERKKSLGINKPKKEKSSHNMIEKRYRTNINDKIKQLRDCVPSLRVLVDESSDDEIKLDGLQRAKKLNKATVLSKSIEYIKHLEEKVRILGEEVELLKGNRMANDAFGGVSAPQIQQLQQFRSPGMNINRTPARQITNSLPSNGNVNVNGLMLSSLALLGTSFYDDSNTKSLSAIPIPIFPIIKSILVVSMLYQFGVYLYTKNSSGSKAMLDRYLKYHGSVLDYFFSVNLDDILPSPNSPDTISCSTESNTDDEVLILQCKGAKAFLQTIKGAKLKNITKSYFNTLPEQFEKKYLKSKDLTDILHDMKICAKSPEERETDMFCSLIAGSTSMPNSSDPLASLLYGLNNDKVDWSLLLQIKVNPSDIARRVAFLHSIELVRDKAIEVDQDKKDAIEEILIDLRCNVDNLDFVDSALNLMVWIQGLK